MADRGFAGGPEIHLVSKPNNWSQSVAQAAHAIDDAELSETRMMQRASSLGVFLSTCPAAREGGGAFSLGSCVSGARATSCCRWSSEGREGRS
jgi:hypothetical protein